MLSRHGGHWTKFSTRLKVAVVIDVVFVVEIGTQELLSGGAGQIRWALGIKDAIGIGSAGEAGGAVVRISQIESIWRRTGRSEVAQLIIGGDESLAVGQAGIALHRARHSSLRAVG